MLFGRIVHQDVDLAELLHCLLDGFSTELSLADITCDQQAFLALFLYQVPGLICVFVLFEIDNRNIRTLFCKGDRDCTTNSAIATSDERYSASQFSTTTMFFVLEPRPWLHFVFAARSSVLMLSWLKFLLPGHMNFPCDGPC